MSSYIMHICISDRVKRNFNLTDKFVYGSVLPDVIKNTTGDRDGTHYINRIRVGKDIRNLPNIKQAIEELTIEDKEVRMGYVAHLIEDLIWFNNFIPMYAIELEENKIQYLKDGSIHTKEEYRTAMYKDYSNCNNYVANKCCISMQNLLANITNLAQDEQHKQIILESTECSLDGNINNNTFMSKEDIDKYIEECTKEVEKVVLELMGE